MFSFHSLIILSFFTAQKMKFSIKNLFSNCEPIRSFLRIWSHLLKKSLFHFFGLFDSCFWLRQVYMLQKTFFDLFTQLHPNMYQEKSEGNPFTLRLGQRKISRSGKTESYTKDSSLYFRRS